MADLRSYMSSEFFEDRRIVEELEEQMRQVAVTFEATFDKVKKTWPYQLTPSDTCPPGVGSQSTTAMILCSVLAMRDHWQKSSRLRASSGMLYENDFPLISVVNIGLAKQDAEAADKIAQAINGLIARWRTSTSSITRSKSFGGDDPMLLGWAIDLIQRFGGTDPTALINIQERILRKCVQRANTLRGATRSSRAPSRTLGNAIMVPTSGHQVGDSSYILGRFARLLRSLRAIPSVNATQQEIFNSAQQVLFERFESRLHEHLSFAEIIDSRFDATELAFCLEGLLLTRPGGVRRTVFDRVMAVLRIAQDKEGYWRSETPMLYQKKGDVLFTVSVEAVNAILASFAMFDGAWNVHNSAASEHIDLVKRYWRWLKARRAIVRVGGDDLAGWHSEHVNDPNLIHLWETSQIAEFLVNFRDQLKRHIARASLKLAACSFKEPAKPKPIDETVDSGAPATERWAAACKWCEPVNSLGDAYQVYKKIGERFVSQRFLPDGKPAYSMLIFGPPGTGKTTVAGSLSWALNYPLITITVSDFLADGHAAIEARAKDLFDMLKAQPRSIVLFDEIDQFMLDRDSKYFHGQETVFQFLTPGMLTKLADLRDSKSVIFVMATNYAERIDAAIKRQGRIDQAFLLLPPDTERRTKFVEKFWTDKKRSIDVKEAAEKSVFLGYGDIESVSFDRDDASAIRRLKESSRAATPQMYPVRFRDKDDEPISDARRTPAEEFLAMLALEAQAEGSKDGPAIKAHIERRCQELFPYEPQGLRQELDNFISRISTPAAP